MLSKSFANGTYHWTAEAGDNLGAGIGEDGLPFLERMTDCNIHMHSHPHKYPSDIWICHQPYLCTNNVFSELLHTLISLKTSLPLPDLTHPCSVPSASPLSCYSLSELIFPHKQLYAVPWFNANFTVGISTLVLKSNYLECLNRPSFKSSRKLTSQSLSRRVDQAEVGHCQVTFLQSVFSSFLCEEEFLIIIAVVFIYHFSIRTLFPLS